VEKQIDMNVKELIEKLKQMPQDLEIRVVHDNREDEANEWVYEVEFSEKGQSGYELYGEVRLLTSE
jgi:cellulose synthase/poly-beta-1,6-N-acetylglucosamine synthase-like glycosyltransferase